jgi:hypothetical protein
MKRKILRISTEYCGENVNFYRGNGPIICDFDCNNILKHLSEENKDVNISSEDFMKAADTIIKYMFDNKLFDIFVDINERNNMLEPAKEMTIAEIEKELGYKVKIVNGDD